MVVIAVGASGGGGFGARNRLDRWLKIDGSSAQIHDMNFDVLPVSRALDLGFTVCELEVHALCIADLWRTRARPPWLARYLGRDSLRQPQRERHLKSQENGSLHTDVGQLTCMCSSPAVDASRNAFGRWSSPATTQI